MTTNSQTHPYDLLEAFALDALDADEEQTVIEHVEDCLECALTIDEHLQTATALAFTAPSLAPPERVRAGLLAAVDLSQPEAEAQRVSVSRRSPSRGWTGAFSASASRWARLLMPITAVAAVAVVAVVVALNVQISGEMDEMKAENNLLREEIGQNEATASAQLALASDTVAQMQGNLQLLQNTLAQSDDQSLVMNPMQPDSDAWGVLVFSGDGTMGVIMASELEPLEEGLAYHVWLMDEGQRTWAGDMQVDEHGWGAIALDMSGPMTGFDTVQLSRAPLALASVGIAGDIVLEASLP